MQKKIMIAGYGSVAREFVRLILSRSKGIKEKYQIDLLVTGIIGSKGMIYQSEGIQLQELVDFGTGSDALLLYSQHFEIPIIDPRFEGDVLIDCTPTNLENGEPGLTYYSQAIRSGMDIVSVAKGALVHSFKEIMLEAQTKGTRIKYSGATAAALPTLDIGEYSLAGTTINRIEGILNGTSNFILTSMMDDHLSFAEALQLAQQKGIAEPNPVLDVKGFDSACKLLLLSNSLLGTDYSLKDIKIRGIDEVSMEEMLNIKQKNGRLKLLATAYKKEDQVVLEVTPCEIHSHHLLFNVNGTEKGVLFETSEMGTICCTGGASNPKGAAAAALKDFINLYRIG
ncbi:homoserine dehydrogenase [Neobacillus drentensis]|uniref:homoserine dehydrogenase n=1 Tax=Neobacillus drentensis TaxID=220684 RepID=UPI003000427C